MSTSNMTASRHQFASWDEAQEYYLENGLTDGLPVVPPTLEKVEAMLEYVGMAPDEVVGIETIRRKRFTAEKLAINSVMAGCKPEYFPAVVAAIGAACERPFNFHASSFSDYNR